MFINNKYFRWYHSIIESAKNKLRQEYTEKHHIIPKSMGGCNDANNIVRLTAREHYVCHWLLTKCTIQPHTAKMICAFHRMCTSNKTQYSNSRAYETNRKRVAAFMSSLHSGRIKTPEHLSKISKAKKGKPLSEKARKAISNSRRGTKLSEKHKQSISRSLCNSYEIISPQGNISIVTDLQRFCVDHNLSHKRLVRTLKSKKPVKKHLLSDNPNTEGWMILRQLT